MPRPTSRPGVRGAFLRSIGDATSGAAPLGLILDDEGDGLTKLLAATDWETSELLAQARRLMAFKCSEGLSRTQGPVAATSALGAADGRPLVLAIDRHGDEPCAPDSSVNAGAYAQMLSAARLENPHARLVVKRDPHRPQSRILTSDVLALADDIVDADIDVAELMALADRVYVVDGYLGLEGLLHHKPVTCFGAPFYAGRGLTDDRSPAAGGRQARSLEAVFAAAYLLAPRYVDPLTGQVCDAATAFERMAAFKRHAERVAGRWIGLNIPPAKHAVMRAFLGGPFSSFRPDGDPATPGEDVRLAAWASWPSAKVRKVRASAPERVANIEDGFIRSVGLGSSFHPASSLVIDRRGIYYDPSTPSDLEHLLATTDFDDEMLARAAALRAEVVALGLSKYNLPAAPMPPMGAAGARRILVPGQVEDDASVLAAGGGLNNLTLLERVRRDNPGAYIAYKEHPDVTARNRGGRLPEGRGRELADVVLTGQDIIACIGAVDEVHTLTSLTGFEALLRDRPVTTYGRPFYAGWGLTEDRMDQAGLPRRRISLDALVAGALILYPLYLDPVTWLPCDALTFVRRMRGLREERQAKGAERPPAGRLRRLATAARYMVKPPKPPRY